jgi:hypothetical protein
MTDWSDIAFAAGQIDYITRLNTLRTRSAALADAVGLGYTPENAASKGIANGYAPLGTDTKVPAAYLPSYVDDVEEYATLAAFPGTGSTGKIYTALDTNKVYRWSGSVYVEISPSPGSTDAVAEGATNQYFTSARAQAEVAPAISAATAKSAPVDADTLGLVDSEALGALKKLSWADLKAALNGLYAALSGFTMAGTLAMAGNLLTQPKFKDIREAAGTATLSSGTLTLDMSTGNNFSITLTGNVTTVSITNVPATGQYVPITLELIQDGTGGRTVTGWSGVKWPGGSAPTITATANAVDILAGYTRDGGTTWRLGRAHADSK